MTRPRIENWKVINDRIVGRVYDHEYFKDGQEITTSRVARWDLKRSKALTVGNTIYELGAPAPYEIGEAK